MQIRRADGRALPNLFPMTHLWTSTLEQPWRDALDRYTAVVSAQGVARLTELDGWYRDELPARLRERRRPHVTASELARLTEWKMARGVWRAPNLVLVRSNPQEAVRYGDQCWSRVLMNWDTWRRQGLTEHRNWWPEVYRDACRHWGIEPDPRVLAFSTSYETVRADLKELTGSA